MFIDQRFGDQVSLRNPGHSLHISKAFSKARKDNLLCDIILIVGEKKYDAHKMVLAAYSDYFKTMFTSQLHDQTQKEIKIESIVPETFDQIMEYFYEGQLTIDMTSVTDLLHASSLLLLSEIEQQCYSYLKDNMTPLNCIQIKTVSETFHNKDLVRKVNSFIEKNFEKIDSDSQFDRLTLNNLKVLLSSNNIVCKSEDIVVSVVEKWLEARHCQDANTIKTIMKSIRYPFLTKDGMKHITDVMKELDKRYDVTYHHSILESELKIQNRHSRRLLSKCRTAHRMEDVIFYINRTGEAFCYNMSSKKSYQLPHCNFFGANGVLTVNDNTVYICGGCSDNLVSTASRSLYSFDPSVSRWKTLPLMKQARRKHCIVFLHNKMYVIGGTDHSNLDVKRSVECYDPVSETWSDKPSTINARIGSSAAASERNIFVVSGEADGAGPYLGQNSAEKYCPFREKWIALPNLNHRRIHSSSVYYKDRLYVFGMNDRTYDVQNFEFLEATGKKWISVKSPYSSPINTALVINDKILTIGGSNWGEDLCLQYSFVRRRGVNSTVVRDFIHAGHRYKYFRYGVLRMLNYDLCKKMEVHCDCNYSDSDSDNGLSDDDDDMWLDNHDPFGLWL